MDKVYTITEQIVRMYLDKIINGDLLEGDKVESEDRLATILNLSRSTCRKAMLQLESMGILSGSKGKVRVVSKDAKRLVPLCYENLSCNYGGKRIALVLLDKRKYFASMRDEALKRSGLLNWSLDIYYNKDFQQEYGNFQEIAEKEYDGCIIIPLRSNGRYIVNNYILLKKARIPFVLLGRPPRTLSCDALYANDYLGSYSITKSLNKNGARQIAYVTGGGVDIVVNADRQSGYEDAQTSLKKEKIYFDAARSDFREKFCEWAGKVSGKIGLNVYSDEFMPQIIECLDDLGKEKGTDYEIFGWSEREIYSEAIGKKYKLVYVPKEEMIDRAFDLLLSRISYGMKESDLHEIFNVKIPADGRK